MAEFPEYYFRVREGGAGVYRVGTENRQRRLELQQIATLNLRTGQVRPTGERELSEGDLAAIRDWMADRAELEEARRLDDILRTVDHLNRTAHWAASEASAVQLDAVTDALLLAMHDLRAVLVRKKAERPERPAKRP